MVAVSRATAITLDGVVAQGRQELVFRWAGVDEACVERVQAPVRHQVLGLFERRGLLSRETIGVMQGWGHSGGFSVHAGERVAAQDSAGRERLLRYRSLIKRWVGNSALKEWQRALPHNTGSSPDRLQKIRCRGHSC